MSITLKGKEYIIKDLDTDASFDFMEILGKIDTSFIDDILKSADSQQNKNSIVNLQNATAAKLIFKAVVQLPKAKKEFYMFLGNLIDEDPSFIGKLPFKETLNLLMEIIKKEGFKDFFTDAFNSAK